LDVDTPNKHAVFRNAAAAANASVLRTPTPCNILRVFHGRWKDRGSTQPDNDIAASFLFCQDLARS